jgi:hypothetical protein
MEETKAVFVDIDGVVNNMRSIHVKFGYSEDSREIAELESKIGPLPYGARYALRTMDMICVALVNKLFDEAKAAGDKIMFVLTSTHRTHFHHGSFGSEGHLDRLRAYLTLMGFKIPENFAVSEVLGMKRGYEIKKFIEDNNVGDYVILDDGTDFLQGQNWVHVDPSIGFSFENYVDACKFLALKEPGSILL